MKGLANVYPSRLRRVMQWSVAGALAASLALLGGGYLASADTAVVPTPTVATVAPTTVATVAPTTVATVAPTTVATVAPTTVATVAPTTVATVAPTTVATQSKSSSAPIRKRDTQPSACVGSGDACPVTMGLRFTNLTDSATSTFRVGDRVAVGVVIKSAVATQSFGLAAYLDFATADYQLLKGSAPAASDDTDVFAVEQSIGGANVQVIGGVNKYAEASGASGGTIGKLDLDLIASPPESGPMSGASLAEGQEYSVATAIFRVKRNDWSGTGKFAITVRPSDAGANRNSVVTGGSSVAGVNIMSGPMDSAGRDGRPTVVRTHAELIAVAPTPNPNAPRRVGDVVPIDIVLRAPAGEYVRHVNAVQATINVASPSFRVTNVTGTPIAKGAPAIYQSTDYQSTDTSRLDIGATATGTFAVDASGNPQVDLNVTGTNVPRLTPGQTAVVGRMYVQAMRKADANTVPSVTVTMAAIGERLPNGTVAFAPMVVASPPSISETSTQCTTKCAELPLGAVRGTTGVSLTVRSPLAATPSVTEAAPAFAYATDTFRPFLGVQGRYVDVAVIVDAGVNAAGSRAVDRFDIDLTYDQNVFASDPPEFTPATGITWRSGASEPALSWGIIKLRLDRDGAVTVPTEVGRVRLHLNTYSYPSPAMAGQAAIRVAPFQGSLSCEMVQSYGGGGTRLWSSTSPFCDIYADVAKPDSHPPAVSTRIGEFDRNANVVNQPAASLQIGARLQGRRGTTDATRFIQPVDVILRASGQTSAAPRLLTPNYHAWNFVPGPDSFTFRAATTTASNQTGGILPCDDGWRPQDAVSNVVLATATFNPGAIPSGTARCINSIEPGTYDVYIKGQSSVGVLVKGVPFLPGQFRTLTGLTLREGDIEQGVGETDRVNIADFTAFSAAYNGYPADITQAASTNWNPMADLNQSGFIDILDFSLLATNYGTSTASQVDTIDLANGLSLSASPEPMPASASRTFGVRLDVGSNTLRHAVVSIDAKGTTPSGSPARVCLAGQATCPSALTDPVRIQFDGNTSGQVALGQIMVSGVATGTATLIIRLEEAEGTAGTPASRAFFKADDLVRSFEVVPDVTWNLVVAPVAEQPNQFTAEIFLTPGTGVTVTEGGSTLSFDGTLLIASCPTPAPTGVTCSATTSGMVTFSIDSPGGVTSLGPVTFTNDGGPTSVGTISSSFSSLLDGMTNLFMAVSPGGSGSRTFQGGGTAESPTVTASRVRTSAVRTRSTSPNANLWVRTDTTVAKVGDIIPVQVGVTTGVRAIDGAQLALKAAPGTRFVDQDGHVVTNGGAFSASGMLPNILRQAVDAGRGLLQVALGRTFASASSGVAGEGVLGTVYLKVTGPVSGDLITLERTGDGQFTTMVAGDGDDLTGTLIGLSADEAVNVPVASSPVTSAPVVGGTSGVAVNLPAAAPAPSRAATNAATNAAIGTATTARPMAMARGLIEDRARGTISVTVPGRFAPIELRTGLLPIAPDQYCPVMRHQTYVRLQDVGIAGATFGVEPGGVLSWVTPDQAGCVNWNAIATGDFTFTKETIMQFQLARAVPGALLWVLDGNRNGELYEVDANGVANYVTAEAFAANQEHFTTVWANVIPVSTAQVDGLAARGSVKR